MDLIDSISFTCWKTAILSIFLLSATPIFPTEEADSLHSADNDSLFYISSALPADSLIQKGAIDKFNFWHETIIPVSLATASGILITIPQLNHWLQERLAWNREEQVNLYDDQVRYAPVAIGILLNISQTPMTHKPLHQAALLLSSYVVADALVYHLKKVTNRKRPDSDDRNSFPSQHASMAFIAATWLDKEAGEASPWIRISGYSLATYVALSRVARNRHYVRDVLMGAAIGLFTTNSLYWLDERLFTSPKNNSSLSWSPYLSPDFTGINLTYIF